MAYEPEPDEESFPQKSPPKKHKKKNKDKKTETKPPPPPPEEPSKYPTDPHWPGPTPWTGQGPAPADTLHPRGTKGWKQALDPRRGWAVGELWKAQAQGRLNLSDKKAVSDFLRGLDITDEVGGGRHLRNLILGNLESEGFGASPIRPDLSWAMERYMPDWKQGMDRAVQGGHLQRDPVTGLYVNPGPNGDLANPGWYNSMGETVPPPYAGAYKTQQQMDEERAFAEQEAAAKPITLTNVPTTTAPPTPAPAPQPQARVTPPAITGYSDPTPAPTNQASLTSSQPPSVSNDSFYTSPTPPAAGTSFNFNVGSQSPSSNNRSSVGGGLKSKQRSATRPAAGWSGTWA